MRSLLALVLVAGCAADPVPAHGVSAFVFVSPGCPIANRYAPEIERIGARFASRVAFTVVYVGASADEARAHAAAYGYTLPTRTDGKRALVRRAAVTVTPEAALFVDGRLRWHGRIDDRFADIGHERPAATRHDLEDALTALVDGRAPPPPSPAVGCLIE